MSEKAILEVNHVRKTFGGLVALKDASFTLGSNEILGLIGPNGAGKTTLFNCIAGALTPNEGSILYKEMDITRMKPNLRSQHGIARTFQITKPFLNMDLVENVTVGAYFGAKIKQLKSAKEKAIEVLEFLGMADLIKQEAKNLSIGNRKKLELARALATNPRILLLDEVIGGLTPTEATEMMDIILKIKQSGVSVIMIEHVMKAVMGVSDRMFVLHYGEIIAEGHPQDIVKNPLVIEAYLGGKKHA